MTHLARVELTNWFRFREAAVDLGPRAYAVEAERDGDPTQSNWTGKSSFAEAPAYALFGWHRFQEGERAPGFEEAWIREGADEGGVALVLSTGASVSRARQRGCSEVVEVRYPGGRKVAGKGAQAEILALVGLSRDDYFSTAHVRQKRAAQLVTARPADRMGLIADWLDFSKLEAACEFQTKRITTLVADRERYEALLVRCEIRIRESLDEEHLGQRLGDEPTPGFFEAGFADWIAREEREAERLEGARRVRAVWEDSERRWRDAEGARAQLVQAETDLAAIPEPEPAGEQTALSAYHAARERARAADRVARGEFDGACPVRPGFACPARDTLNAGCAEAREASLAAAAEEQARRTAAAEESAARERADRVRRDRARLEERVELFRARVDAGPKIDFRSAEPPAVAQADLRAAQDRVTSARTALALYKRASADVAKLRAEQQKLKADLATLERVIGHARAARLVLGRGGAQRRIAERAVDLIARGANARLAASGIDLRVGMSWRREGAELASACEGCGCPFQRSAAVRVCPRCSEPRGRAVLDRLDVELSDRSGAAEDLAGLALQRAACAFLRRRRAAPWATLILDEPFGALDERHRGAVARSLAAIVEEDGLAQAFVVAHQPGILESLPGRILIRGVGAESTVEVSE